MLSALILSSFTVGCLLAQKTKPQESTTVSSILKKNVQQILRLPDNYDSSKKTYAVLFVLQTTGEQVDEIVTIAQTLHKNNGVPELIVVGLNVEDKLERSLENKVYDQYLSFLEQEMIPSIEKKYRCNGQKMLYGRSLSGSFTLYALLKKPSLFKGYIASSKEWYDKNNDYFNNLANNALKNADAFKGRKIFLASLNGAYSNQIPEEVDKQMGAFSNLLLNKSGKKIASKYQAFDDWGISAQPGLKEGLIFVAK